MTAFTIQQLSDTHLSNRYDYYHQNNMIIARALTQETCDYIVHTGDVTLDGIRHAHDFEDCSEFRAILGNNVKYLPGNHDIGDNPRFCKADNPNNSEINSERLKRHEDYFGDTWWSFDQDNWKIIGINAMIIGSGLPQEQQQYDWVCQEVKKTGDKFIAVFSHLPIFIDKPEDGLTLNYWTIDPSGHEHMSTLINHTNLRFIASGHLHQQRSRKYTNINLEWCPSSAFTTGPTLVPEMGGNRQVGYLVHKFQSDGNVETQMVTPKGIVNHHLEEVASEVYPNL